MPSSVRAVVTPAQLQCLLLRLLTAAVRTTVNRQRTAVLWIIIRAAGIESRDVTIAALLLGVRATVCVKVIGAVEELVTPWNPAWVLRSIAVTRALVALKMFLALETAASFGGGTTFDLAEENGLLVYTISLAEVLFVHGIGPASAATFLAEDFLVVAVNP